MKVEYSSNNSGGYWWLKDEDWYALEKAGWSVKWVKDEENRWSFFKGDRWLGALAKRAEKEFETLKEAILEFEKVTGQNTSDEGCNCCGPPHYFSARDEEGDWIDSCSGDDCIRVIHSLEEVPTLREAIEKIQTSNQTVNE